MIQVRAVVSLVKKLTASQQAVAAGPPPRRCPTNTTALCGAHTIVAPWQVTVTGSAVTGSVEEITTSVFSMAGMPSVSIAHIAHTSMSSIRTRWRVGTAENG